MKKKEDLKVKKREKYFFQNKNRKLDFGGIGSYFKTLGSPKDKKFIVSKHLTVSFKITVHSDDCYKLFYVNCYLFPGSPTFLVVMLPIGESSTGLTFALSISFQGDVMGIVKTFVLIESSELA